MVEEEEDPDEEPAKQSLSGKRLLHSSKKINKKSLNS